MLEFRALVVALKAKHVLKDQQQMRRVTKSSLVDIGRRFTSIDFVAFMLLSKDFFSHDVRPFALQVQTVTTEAMASHKLCKSTKKTSSVGHEKLVWIAPHGCYSHKCDGFLERQRICQLLLHICVARQGHTPVSFIRQRFSSFNYKTYFRHSRASGCPTGRHFQDNLCASTVPVRIENEARDLQRKPDT